MTIVRVKRNRNHVTYFECDGHTGYGVAGEDIVCSAVSSIVQTAVLGLMSVAAVPVTLVRDDEKGFLSCKLPDNLNAETRRDADMIIESMLLGLADLYEGYSDFIELEAL